MYIINEGAARYPINEGIRNRFGIPLKSESLTIEGLVDWPYKSIDPIHDICDKYVVSSFDGYFFEEEGDNETSYLSFWIDENKMVFWTGVGGVCTIVQDNMYELIPPNGGWKPVVWYKLIERAYSPSFQWSFEDLVGRRLEKACIPDNAENFEVKQKLDARTGISFEPEHHGCDIDIGQIGCNEYVTRLITLLYRHTDEPSKEWYKVV